LTTEIGNIKNSGVLRAHINNSKTPGEKNLREGFLKIDDLCEKLDLPTKHRNTAKELLKGVNDSKPIKSVKDVVGFSTASVYGACKIGGIPRQIKEFTALTGLEKKVIGKYYKRIEQISKEKFSGDVCSGLNMTYQSATPAQMIPRFASSLGIQYKTQILAEHLAQKAVDLGITSGKAPTTVAAAAIFMSSRINKINKPIKDICLVTGVSEPTIRKCLQDMESNQAKLFDEVKKFL
jgi:transcription initiation factor TFIIB